MSCPSFTRPEPQPRPVKYIKYYYSSKKKRAALQSLLYEISWKIVSFSLHLCWRIELVRYELVPVRWFESNLDESSFLSLLIKKNPQLLKHTLCLMWNYLTQILTGLYCLSLSVPFKRTNQRENHFISSPWLSTSVVVPPPCPPQIPHSP